MYDETVPIVFHFRVFRRLRIPIHLINNCFTIYTFRYRSVVDWFGEHAFFVVYVSLGFFFLYHFIRVVQKRDRRRQTDGLYKGHIYEGRAEAAEGYLTP